MLDPAVVIDMSEVDVAGLEELHPSSWRRGTPVKVMLTAEE